MDDDSRRPNVSLQCYFLAILAAQKNANCAASEQSVENGRQSRADPEARPLL